MQPQDQLKVYNTLTRQREIFTPHHSPFVGMYVCGPTVYGQAHLGHARSAINFDVIQRYLKHLGYQVRYVKNITDVGHLEQDADEGADKVAKQAQLESLTPMEVVQRYTSSYRRDMALLNVQSPSIEPHASGHITEQIAMIQQILQAGLAYEAKGSVYFDVADYARRYTYGELSGSIPADLLAGTRPLAGQAEKRGPLDFALWKKAKPGHSMHWPSPWGEGFPGWHIACTTMATKYLGKQLDIHGGGMDLLFPHHECELAQAQAAHQTTLAKYWLHNNVITVDGQKMSKSLGNYITLEQLFQGTHDRLTQAYSPMALRFFVLKASYRSTLSFSNTALQDAYSGYRRIINGLKAAKTLVYVEEATLGTDKETVAHIQQYLAQCYQAMNDDFNTAQVIAALFGLLKFIHALKQGQLHPSALGPAAFQQLKSTYILFVEDILGLQETTNISAEALLKVLLKLYRQAKEQQQYDRVDAMRVAFKHLGIALQDTPTGVDWYYEG
ncbi:MAG: cysteine--tRNA ligase [Bacteroidota bacterium]